MKKIKFIPKSKLSKKVKREMDKSQRQVWSMNPVTRKAENPKAYKRTKPRFHDDDTEVNFFVIPFIPAKTQNVP